ncbi:MAG: GIY-YIG nuclease family protein [Weeksellaceae bacterium]
MSSSFLNSEAIWLKSDDNIIDFFFTFNSIEGNDFIIFNFNPKQIRPRKSDKVLFLFENGQQIEFEIKTNPISSKNIYKENVIEYKDQIFKNDLDLFSNSNLKRWKIELINDKKEVFGGKIGGDKYYLSQYNLQIVVKKFATDYINIVKATIPTYQPIELIKTEQKKDEIRNESCFVYLMNDTVNNFHKIGISNNPEYRERTLQSEKPTIELIASKEFPVRKIAESFEKALHETYSKKRIRGEWFDLSQEDVQHIIKSLE